MMHEQYHFPAYPTAAQLHQVSPFAFPTGPVLCPPSTSAPLSVSRGQSPSYSAPDESRVAASRASGGAPKDSNDVPKVKRQACRRCRKLKMKCEFQDDGPCKRCLHGDHECSVQPRQSNNGRTARDALLREIRQKDAMIAQLMKHIYNPSQITPLALAATKLDIELPDGKAQDTLAWVEKLEKAPGKRAASSALQMPQPKRRMSLSQSDSSDSEAGDDTPPTSAQEVGASISTAALPPPSFPLGVLAEAAQDKGDAEEATEPKQDSVGLENTQYFRPGPGADLDLRRIIIEREMNPEILEHGLVTPEDVNELFRIFFDNINPSISLLDPVLHTPSSVLGRCPFLFTVICAISSRYYAEKPQLYSLAMHFAKKAAASALINGFKTLEMLQAYILLGDYSPPARTWEEDRTWIYKGLAIRLATDLNLNQTTIPKDCSETQARELLNRTRTWLICVNIDWSAATQFGRSSTIQEDDLVRQTKDWFKLTKWNTGFDVHLCAYVQLLRIMSQFGEIMFTSADKTRLSANVDFQAVTRIYDDLLTGFSEEWNDIFAEYSNPQDCASIYRARMMPFIVNYCKLVMHSFGFQSACKKGLKKGDPYFFRCWNAATSVIEIMVDKLAPTGYLSYAAECTFIFATFASAFLLKLFRPKFAEIVEDDQKQHILQLITRLVRVMNEQAFDNAHTPRLYARFLETLLKPHLKQTPSSQSSSQTTVKDVASQSQQTQIPQPFASRIQPSTGSPPPAVSLSPHVTPSTVTSEIESNPFSMFDEMMGAADALSETAENTPYPLASVRSLGGSGWYDHVLLPGFGQVEGIMDFNPFTLGHGAHTADAQLQSVRTAQANAPAEWEWV